MYLTCGGEARGSPALFVPFYVYPILFLLACRPHPAQVMMGDGQVSQGDMVVKPNATKVRKLSEGRVLAGYAGSTADALTLMERLEGKLEEHEGKGLPRH